ncbi:MAG: response regulator, partial [Candidatus Omnitrophica bacterium]|nr:response regulator [Candidatus Omnitrophota bacterium]
AVASQIQAEPRLKATPIVFLTAIVSSQEAHHGVIGGHPFLAKPVSMEELLQCIDKQLYA